MTGWDTAERARGISYSLTSNQIKSKPIIKVSSNSNPRAYFSTREAFNGSLTVGQVIRVLSQWGGQPKGPLATKSSESLNK